jgi:hypothetical protein
MFQLSKDQVSQSSSNLLIAINGQTKFDRHPLFWRDPHCSSKVVCVSFLIPKRFESWEVVRYNPVFKVCRFHANTSSPKDKRSCRNIRRPDRVYLAMILPLLPRWESFFPPSRFTAVGKVFVSRTGITSWLGCPWYLFCRAPISSYFLLIG